jgi:hypothetical protein
VSDAPKRPLADDVSADELVKALGMSGISKSQVSRLCSERDEKVASFLNRSLEGHWPYLWLAKAARAQWRQVADQLRPENLEMPVAVPRPAAQPRLGSPYRSRGRYGDKLFVSGSGRV